MENWIKEALAQWNRDKVVLNKGASVVSIERTEDLIGYKFPKDFRELYLEVNGFLDFEIRGFLLSLWSLDRILGDFDKQKECIIFCDHSLSLCQYGFHRSKAGIFKSYTHHQEGPITHIADSFRELIKFMNSDSEVLF